MFHLEKSILFK